MAGEYISLLEHLKVYNILTILSGNYRYELEIVQQPIRARMCGLGDKDRRQISPPPFIKLNVYEKETNQLVDVDDVDITTFVLVVELWSVDENEDLNLNQNIMSEEHSSPIVDGKLEQEQQQEQEKQSSSSLTTTLNATSSVTSISKEDGEAIVDETQIPDGKIVTPKPNQESTVSPKTSSPTIQQQLDASNITKTQRDSTGSESEGSLGEIPTRNLIGNLVTNAFKLFDDKNEKGIWFILHDLSVRIEGEFKLKFSFVDLSNDEMIFKFSEPFRVYSAKKFPGVVDSSQLGRVFASQGVKIPIRRDTKDH